MRTIQQNWHEYCQMTFDKDTPIEVITQCRQAFYAGIMMYGGSITLSFVDGADLENPEHVAKMREYTNQTSEELRAFALSEPAVMAIATKLANMIAKKAQS